MEGASFKTVRRNNSDDFPVLVNCNEKLSIQLEKQDECDVFSCNVGVETLETLFDSFFKCKLSNIPLGGGREQFSICRSFIKNYSNSGSESSMISKLIKKFFGNNLFPSAMFFENVSELSKKILLMYQFSYAHYILGKYHEMKNSFPSYCCGFSSINLVYAFWEAGIISALRVNNASFDHTYVVVPFFLKEYNQNGIVFIDPTSDQLINDKKKKIRNLTAVIFKEEWVYKTDWENGANLYPEIVETSVSHKDETWSYKDYLREAFKNPVIVI